MFTSYSIDPVKFIKDPETGQEIYEDCTAEEAQEYIIHGHYEGAAHGIDLAEPIFAGEKSHCAYLYAMITGKVYEQS